MATCSCEGCEVGVFGRGLCSRHYSHAKRRGSLPETWDRQQRTAAKSPRLCSIPNCGREHSARGFCAMHWARWRTHGDPLHVRRPVRSMTISAVPAGRIEMTEAARRRGQIRRAIEDREAELHLAKLLADDDY